MHAVFVNRPDQRQLFDQAFHVFWRNPELLKKMLATVLPQMNVEMPRDEGAEMIRRLAEALHPHQQTRESPEEQVEIDAAMTFSDREQLRTMDFEKMSLEELARAKAAIARLELPIHDIPTRRYRPRPARRPRRYARDIAGGAALGRVARTEAKKPAPPPAAAGRAVRHLRLDEPLQPRLSAFHAFGHERPRPGFTFVFGTRLTNITRFLRYRDVDVALDKVAEAVADWSGGTRIGQCVREFNRFWSRRVLGQGAVVLMITDGLDRDAGTGLAPEMDRLHRSCRKLIWLNPLLRYEGFEPRSLGMKAMLPHVDEFRPVHNLESLETLIDVISAAATRQSAAAIARESFAPRDEC